MESSDRMSGYKTDSSDREKASSSEQSGAASPDIRGNTRLIAWFENLRKPLRSWIAANPCVPADEVDDLIQEVFLRLLQYSDDVMVENPQGYLFRVATNVVIRWRELGRVRMVHDDAWLEALEIDADEQPGNALERTWASRHVWAAVNRLPARQREVLLLHMIEGMTYKQIAEARGVTYRIVLRDLTRAYNTLRKKLRSYEL
ncbi:MAG TPA: RNA polymerase sigma factor [Steroidobacter sp.]